MWNPLTPEQMAELEATYGRWTARRTVAMISPAEPFETVKRVAESMYQGYKTRALAWLPPTPSPTPAPPKARSERRPKAAPEIEEFKKAITPGVLTPELETSLTDAALEEIIRMKERYKRELRTEEKVELARAVVAWAGEEGVRLTEEQGMAVVNRALARFAPVRT
jgi:hypothetical protein